MSHNVFERMKLEMKLSGVQLRQKRKEMGLSQAKLAELSCVPQHVISSYELEKTEPSTRLIEKLFSSLGNEKGVETLAKRPKRYQKHDYSDVKICRLRASRVVASKGNARYRLALAELMDRHIKKKKTASAISLFSGCGGFSLGVSAAGFDVRGFVELDDKLSNIYKNNFPDSTRLGGDVRDVSTEFIESFLKSGEQVDAIFGGPPCQGFSLSGKRDVDDPRNRLFEEYLRIVKSVNPKVAVLENVKLLTSMKNDSGGYVRDDICLAFSQIGYSVSYYSINAKDYGIPQHRERIIFVAIRSDIIAPPSIPSPTHGGQEVSMFASPERYRTFADAVSDLPYLESGMKTEVDVLHEAVRHPNHVIEWLWDVNEGQSAHDNADPNLRPPSGYNTTYKRQKWLEPAATVQTTFGMISGCRNVHPIATRSLTIREAARIQSFPDSFKFEGTLNCIRTGIGNAVPPILGYKIGVHMLKIMAAS